MLSMMMTKSKIRKSKIGLQLLPPIAELLPPAYCTFFIASRQKFLIFTQFIATTQAAATERTLMASEVAGCTGN